MRQHTKMSAAAVLILILSGCGFTPQGDAFRAAVRDLGAQAADAELANLEWGLCNAVSMGAFARRYGPNPKKVAAWRELCLTEPVAP